MRSIFFAIIFSFVASIGCLQAAYAQNYETIFSGFDSRNLSRTDKRFLQAALAFEGHYNGLLDGDWGRISQRAMSRYSSQEFNGPSEDWHMAMLAFSFFELIEVDGWDIYFVPALNLSFLWPFKTIVTDADSENFVNFRHSRSTLAVSLGIMDQKATQGVHDFTMRAHQSQSTPYSVRKSNLAVSSVTKADGSLLYTRSDFVAGSWSTIILAAAEWDAELLNAMAASIAVGQAPKLILSENGYLYSSIKKTVAFVNTLDDEEASSDLNEDTAKSEDRSQSKQMASGSGFIVSADGHILTNAHVIDGCSTIRVNGQPADLVASSEEFDLALLVASKSSSKKVAVFATNSAKLNSDVTAIGYPYAGLLGGMNVTRGSVSSLVGLGGDAKTMQITAPVQSGNSGGPLLSSDGKVVGVVVSKLDAVAVADIIGDFPQNVNFAIRGEIAKLFLSINGVEPQLSMAEDRMKPEDLADLAKSFTRFIDCE